MARKKSESPPAAAASEPVVELVEQPQNAASHTHDELERMKRQSQSLLLRAALANPFPVGSIKWLPKMVKNNRALAMPYVDARLVMDRLDEVCGVDGWQDEFTTDSSGCVVCRLSIWTPDKGWVTKEDVGSPSEQPDMGDRLKAAHSDALKRAAVKFGVGRYLYRIPSQWADYDPQRKQLARTPQLPDFAVPKTAPLSTPVYHEHDEGEVAAAATTVASPPPPPPPPPAAAAANGNGQRATSPTLQERLEWWDEALSQVESVGDINGLIYHQFKNEQQDFKVPIWNAMQKYIKERFPDWKYHQGKKKYVEPQPAADAEEGIPY